MKRIIFGGGKMETIKLSSSVARYLNKYKQAPAAIINNELVPLAYFVLFFADEVFPPTTNPNEYRHRDEKTTVMCLKDGDDAKECIFDRKLYPKVRQHHWFLVELAPDGTLYSHDPSPAPLTFV
jgi:hypothetical protein